jgi:hypothetical protein
MTQHEKEPGHEKLIDYDFRISSIEGMGAGAGFQLKNLTLPENYGDLIDNIDKKISLQTSFSRIFEADCRHFYLPQGFIEFKDNLLSQIVFGGLGESSRLFLDENNLDYETGAETYRFENVENIGMSLVLAKTAAKYINFLKADQGQDEKCSHVDYFNNGYRDVFFSENLKIPKNLAEKAKKTESNSFKNKFALEASNIAGRFGVTVASLGFENMFLRWFSIQEGNACDYGIDHGSILDYSYTPHNVDSPRQALVLHGIGAAYINRLLDARSANPTH